MSTLDKLQKILFQFGEPQFNDANDCFFWKDGLIDSMGLIKFSVLVESEFGISLSSEDYADERFKHLHGLAEIVDQKLTG